MRQSKANRKPSIADVAAAVGVSKTTISRYLHGKYDYMSAETKERIDATIEELGYRPNKMAQSLKASNSHLIGVTIANISNPFSSQLLKGMQAECRARGIQLLVSDVDDNPALERAAIESLLDSQVDGLIVNTAGDNDDYLTEFATKDGNPPMATLDRFIKPVVCDCITTDNAAGVDEMLDHLVAQRFDHVVFVTQPAAAITTRVTRVTAFRSYIAAHGAAAGAAGAADIAGAVDTATGAISGTISGEVLEYNDLAGLATGLERIMAEQAGRRVCLFSNNEDGMCDIFEAYPAALDGHIGLCAFATKRWARYSGRGITCLDQNPVRMGRTCAAKLAARIYDGDDSPYELLELPAELCVYASTTEV
ncbi:LacI family transcriptional regulator [Bifidobacterium primatium]|uniref:LacI family transcriptional regulator n=1 Tax=Bifidobacterium primatium TaxID=2045438 RepID=A0A2M9H987_9BIFI|nr:LacI family DNA-binding transcriptional regulator [Bifidobacterium primatium]PJM73367.1 LacI family transcriptional regulator [Bifidobacterium primatium]